jgi:hypothetical protein
MTRSSSIQLACWWIAIADLHAKIDNEIVPVSIHLGVDDPDLIAALETLSKKIKLHFDQFKLQAVPIET